MSAWKYAEGEARAEKLFLKHLTPSQRKSWRIRHCFRVRSSLRGATYYWEIHKLSSENVLLLKVTGDRDQKKNMEDYVDTWFCGGPYLAPSFHDFWLGQKLILEADLETFLAVANWGV